MFFDCLCDVVCGGGLFDFGDVLCQNQGVGSGVGVLLNELIILSDDQVCYFVDLICFGMVGNFVDFVLIDKDGVVKRGSEIDYNGVSGGYVVDLMEVVNYVLKYDNQMLWDMISYKVVQEVDFDICVWMQVVLLVMVMFGQGIVFDQQGLELLCFKFFICDLYDFGDWFNCVDYFLQDNNYNVGMLCSSDDGSNYDIIVWVKDVVVILGEMEFKQMIVFYQELIVLCKLFLLFIFGDGVMVMKCVDFCNIGVDQQMGLLVMIIDDGMQVGVSLDSCVDGIVVVINVVLESWMLQDFVGILFQLSVIQQVVGDWLLVSGVQVVVDGLVMLLVWLVVVFELLQGELQGVGLLVSSK